MTLPRRYRLTRSAHRRSGAALLAAVGVFALTPLAGASASVPVSAVSAPAHAASTVSSLAAPPVAAVSMALLGSDATRFAGLTTVPAAEVARITGDDGRRSFGIQPSGPDKVDPRPNLTYQNVTPGQRILDHVAIINISDKPVTLDVYPADAYNNAGGGFDLVTGGVKSKDLGSWVTLRRTKATVPARSALITPIEIRVPKDAEPGDHAAGIVASFKTKVKDATGAVVTVDQRVGTRVYARVKGTLRPEITIETRGGYQSWFAPLRGDAKVTYTIRNTGNVRLTGTRSVRVSNLIGGSSDVDVPEMGELLPGFSFSFTDTVSGVVPTFVNTAHVTVDPVSVSGNVDPALAQASAADRFWTVSWPLVVIMLAAAGYALRWRYLRRDDASGAGPTQWGGDGAVPPAGPPAPASGSLSSPVGAAPARSDALTPRVATIRSRRVGIAAAILTVLTVLVVGAAPAQAKTADGSLTFIPGKGNDTTPLYVVTAGACPAEATTVIGTLFGKGLPAEGVGAIPNTSAAAYHGGAFGVPPGDAFSEIAARAGIKFDGPYRLVVSCTDELVTKTYATFTGTITFSSPTTYTAPVPTKVPATGVPIGYLALVFPEYAKIEKADKLAAAAEMAANAPGASTPAPAASKPAAAAGAPASGSEQATPTSANSTFVGSGVTIFGAVILLLLAVACAGYLVTRRPAVSDPVASPTESVMWPDDVDRGA